MSRMRLQGKDELRRVAYIEKPFWGDSCPVKSCCEGKELEHCGKCNNFPCDLLNQFAYNKEQGDNGKRIEQCKKWSLNQF